MFERFDPGEDISTSVTVKESAEDQ